MFIKIGNRIVSTNAIVSISTWVRRNSKDVEVKTLTVHLTNGNSIDFGGAEAEAVEKYLTSIALDLTPEAK